MTGNERRSSLSSSYPAIKHRPVLANDLDFIALSAGIHRVRGLEVSSVSFVLLRFRSWPLAISSWELVVVRPMLPVAVSCVSRVTRQGGNAHGSLFALL